VYISFNLLVV